MNVGRKIADALASFDLEAEEAVQRDLYQRARKVLSAIPNGTPDADLTPEQRQAWVEYEAALAWFEEREREA